MRLIKFLLFVTCLSLQGCPHEENDDLECEKVMVCQDDLESYCDPPADGSCIRECYYFVYEACWEECKQETGS